MVSMTRDDESADHSGDAAIIAALDEGRRKFLALVDEIRPDLHRYCARMTGSIADGEDVVQDTLARAYYQLSELKGLPQLRPWLFRIAHNRAIDHRRRDAYRASEPFEAALDIADDAGLEPDHALARSQAVRAAVSSFLRLAPAQRACVILKDVLDHSIDEIADLLELSVPAVKAALHRGRALLREVAPAPHAASIQRAMSPALARYASLFNAHDWDGVRALLADDVKLDLVSRRKAAGRREVGIYFTNYERVAAWHLIPGWLDGDEVIAVVPAPGARPRYFIEVTWRDDRVIAIRDFRYVRYIVDEAAIELAND
jgi:RNA polymerase sigma factor (sigma-70 family)